MRVSRRVCHEKHELFYPAQNGELGTTLHFGSSYVEIGLVIMRTSFAFYMNARAMNTQ